MKQRHLNTIGRQKLLMLFWCRSSLIELYGSECEERSRLQTIRASDHPH